jgi:hypothetical protein
MSIVYQHIVAAIRRSPYVTSYYTDASVLVPSVDVSCWCEDCMYPAFDNIIDHPHRVSLEIGQKLRSLPYWNNGINHILFELSDAPCMPYDIGHAIAAKSGLSEFHLRSGHDISMPLFGMVEFSEAQRRLPPAARKFLLTFRGTRSERSDAMRNELYRIHNGEDIVLLIACRWFGQGFYRDYVKDDPKCAEEEKRFQEYTFTELSVESKFALIVEGFGYHSFRLTEMMSAGSIPVICVDHYVPPYSDILDWDNFSIRVPEHKFEQVRIAVGQREYIFACGVCIYRLIHQPCIEAHELATALTPSLCTMISQTRCCLLESILLSFNKVYEQHTVLHD